MIGWVGKCQEDYFNDSVLNHHFWELTSKYCAVLSFVCGMAVKILSQHWVRGKEAGHTYHFSDVQLTVHLIFMTCGL